MKVHRTRSSWEDRRCVRSTSGARPSIALKAIVLASSLATMAGPPASAGYVAISSGQVSAGPGPSDNSFSFALYNMWDPSTCGYADARISQESTSTYGITEPVTVVNDTLAVNTSLSLTGSIYNGLLAPLANPSVSATQLSFGPIVIQTGPAATITPSFTAQQTAYASTSNGQPPNPDIVTSGPVTNSTGVKVNGTASSYGSGTGMPAIFFTQEIIYAIDQKIYNNNNLVGESTGSVKIFSSSNDTSINPLLVLTTGNINASDVAIVPGPVLGFDNFTVGTNFSLNTALNTLTSTTSVVTTVNAELMTTLYCPEPSSWFMFVMGLFMVGVCRSSRGRGEKRCQEVLGMRGGAAKWGAAKRDMTNNQGPERGPVMG